ncbi:MAG TPA: HypC/HybG/HupF family hydrogenase formation chaperone [Candidatus Dormibacteraeota bacterium]|jgi:hydrogenase expression/formation protein HypC|nr:HypC/HybG/HupF family hydrogenase formation chaperone [Candidatus Dormibacteraeota bacterium]
MCLAVPGRVLELVDEERQIAKVEVAGVRRNVSIGLLTGDERPRPGDYVLIHVGFALTRIDEQEALETQRVLESLGQAYLDEVEQIKASSID